MRPRVIWKWGALNDRVLKARSPQLRPVVRLPSALTAVCPLSSRPNSVKTALAVTAFPAVVLRATQSAPPQHLCDSLLPQETTLRPSFPIRDH